MKPSELLKSKEFKEASQRVAAWKSRLEKGGQDDVLKVRDEKAAFFGKMRETRPDLYAAFRVEDKTLGETIFKKLTGQDVVMD